MPDEHSALTQRHRECLAGVARVACKDEVGAGRQDLGQAATNSGSRIPLSLAPSAERASHGVFARSA